MDRISFRIYARFPVIGVRDGLASDHEREIVFHHTPCQDTPLPVSTRTLEDEMPAWLCCLTAVAKTGAYPLNSVQGLAQGRRWQLLRRGTRNKSIAILDTGFALDCIKPTKFCGFVW